MVTTSTLVHDFDANFYLANHEESKYNMNKKWTGDESIYSS